MRSARGALSPGRASHHVPAAPPLYAPAGSRDGQIVRLRTLRLNEFLRSFWIPPSSIGRLLRLRRNPHSAPSVRQHDAHPPAVLAADLELSEHQRQYIVDRERQGTKPTAVTTGSIIALMAPRGNT